MKDVSLKDLLEAGCHFGHQVARWNPRAASFIYASRDGVHIIDLVKTKAGLEAAADFVKTLAAEGQTLIFVGTKRQAKAIVEAEAKRASAFYLVARWPGGLLTNFGQIKKNLEKLVKRRQEKKEGVWQKFTKKEQGLLEKELAKLEGLYGGIANLDQLPGALFLVDMKKEEAAVREADKTGVKTIALVDTNGNPDQIDYPIPANDDAIGSIKLIISFLADAYLEGKGLLGKKETSEDKGNKESGEETKEVKVKEKVSERRTVKEKKPRVKKAKTKKTDTDD